MIGSILQKEVEETGGIELKNDDEIGHIFYLQLERMGLTGYTSLNILFSDHRLSKESLANFGKVISHLRAKLMSSDVVFWAFFKYVSDEHLKYCRIRP